MDISKWPDLYAYCRPPIFEMSERNRACCRVNKMTRHQFPLMAWRWVQRNPSTIIALIALLVSIATLYFTNIDRKRSERAYVYASPGNVYNVSDGNTPEPRIIIGNSGQTLAKNAKRWAAAAILPPKSSLEIAELGFGEREEGILDIVPRVQHALIRYSQQLRTGQQKQISEKVGPLRLYVYGRIEYADIFTDDHFTNFCFVYYGEMQDWPQNGGLGFDSTQAKYCEGHNNSN